MTDYPVTQLDTEAIRARWEEARSAVRFGAIRRGFDGPDGVTKDEALEYANAILDDIPALLAALESARGLAARLEAELAHAAPSVLQDDVRDLLLACGLDHYARPYSPHEVVQREVLPAINRLEAQNAKLWRVVLAVTARGIDPDLHPPSLEALLAGTEFEHLLPDAEDADSSAAASARGHNTALALVRRAVEAVGAP